MLPRNIFTSIHTKSRSGRLRLCSRCDGGVRNISSWRIRVGGGERLFSYPVPPVGASLPPLGLGLLQPAVREGVLVEAVGAERAGAPALVEVPARLGPTREQGVRGSGGQTSGGQRSGGQTSGGQTSGGQSSGGQRSGGQTSGGQSSGDQTSGVIVSDSS